MSYYARNNVAFMMRKPYDVHATAFIATHEANTGVAMGSVQKNAVNNRYLRYKNILPTPNGSVLWTILNAASPKPVILPFCPINDTTASASAYQIDFVKALVRGSFINFVSGDFTPQGVIGGATKYYKTNFSLSAYPKDNVGHYVYLRSNPLLAANIFGVNENLNVNRTGVVVDGSGTTFKSYINNTTIPADTTAVPTRFIGAQRGNSTQVESVKDGVVIQTETLMSINPTARAMYWFGRNYNGTLSNPYDGQISAIFEGMPYLTANELADLYWIEQLYQQEIITGGRQV